VGPLSRLRARTACWVAVLGCATVLLAGCSGDDPGAATPSASPTFHFTIPPRPKGITLSFIQQRFDEGTRKAGLTVIDNTGRPVRVRSVDLDWPGYPGPPQPLRYVVPAGLQVDLPYRLPEPACDPGLLDVPPRGVVTTPQGRVSRPIDEKGLRFLTRIWQASCNERLLARTADVSYGGPWRETTRGGQPVLLASMVLTRTDTGTAVELTDVQGSPLFDLVLGQPRRLEPGAARVAVPLLIEPGRCDDHARSSATTPFTFRYYATLGEDTSQVALIRLPSLRDQNRMFRFLDRACAAS
jgi:hypothetical protein